MELAVIASETHEKAIAYFKVAEQYGYKFIMEIKKIRDDRLYKEIGFSSFDDYCDKAWKVDRTYMDQRIVIADSLGNEQDFEDTYPRLGHSKSLMLARMEPEVRQQIESTVNVADTTVKKLKELEQKLADTQELFESTKESAEHWKSVAENQTPIIETVEVQVIPQNIQKKLEDLEFNNGVLKDGLKKKDEKLKQYELHNTVDFNEELSKKQLTKLQQEADITTVNLRIAYKSFIEKASISSYIQGALATASPYEKERLAEMAETALQIITQTQLALKGRKLGVVNE